MNTGDSATEQLLRRASLGDTSAVEQLFVRHRDRLRRMIMVRMDPRLSARIDPSDVLQESLVVAFRKLPDYLRCRDCAFYPWLRKIAWEQLVSLHRRHLEVQKRSVKREAGFPLKLPDDSALELADRVLVSSTSPTARLLKDELRRRVSSALDALNPKNREVVVLRHLEQLTFRDIADVVGVTESAVLSRYRRAIEQLHRLLADESPETS